MRRNSVVGIVQLYFITGKNTMMVFSEMKADTGSHVAEEYSKLAYESVC